MKGRWSPNIRDQATGKSLDDRTFIYNTQHNRNFIYYSPRCPSLPRTAALREGRWDFHYTLRILNTAKLVPIHNPGLLLHLPTVPPLSFPWSILVFWSVFWREGKQVHPGFSHCWPRKCFFLSLLRLGQHSTILLDQFLVVRNHFLCWAA